MRRSAQTERLPVCRVLLQVHLLLALRLGCLLPGVALSRLDLGRSDGIFPPRGIRDAGSVQDCGPVHSLTRGRGHKIPTFFGSFRQLREAALCIVRQSHGRGAFEVVIKD